MKSKIIALSAISASFIAIVLTLGAYFTVVDIFMVLLASCIATLPIYKNSYLGSVLAFLAGGVLAFLFSSFNIMSIVFPSYFTFFGIFPIVKLFMREKKVNKILAYIIGFIWCVAVFYGLYFYYTLIMNQPFQNLPPFIVNNIYIFVGLLGAVFYVVFERFIFYLKVIEDKFLCKIIK